MNTSSSKSNQLASHFVHTLSYLRIDDTIALSMPFLLLKPKSLLLFLDWSQTFLITMYIVVAQFKYLD